LGGNLSILEGEGGGKGRGDVGRSELGRKKGREKEKLQKYSFRTKSPGWRLSVALQKEGPEKKEMRAKRGERDQQRNSERWMGGEKIWKKGINFQKRKKRTSDGKKGTRASSKGKQPLGKKQGRAGRRKVILWGGKKGRETNRGGWRGFNVRQRNTEGKFYGDFPPKKGSRP